VFSGNNQVENVFDTYEVAWKRMRYIWSFLKENGHLEDLEENGRITLKWCY